MANHSKYVVGLSLDDINNRRLEAIVFARTMTHRQAAELFGFGEDVVGAGFVTIDVKDGKVDAILHGHSESLGIGQSELDAEYVKRALNVVSYEEYNINHEKRLADYSAGVEIVQARRAKAREEGNPRTPFGARRRR